MPKIYFARLGRFGNNLIQYCTACIFHILFGHEIVHYSSMCKDAYEIHDEDPLFESLRNFLRLGDFSKEVLKTHPFAKRDILLHGFFQQSDLLLLFRKEILNLFTESNIDFISHAIRVCDVVKTKGLAKPNELVVHVRLDDFENENQSYILHPRVYLQQIRKLSSPIRIISQKPKQFAEELYFALFEEFHPTVQYSSLLEDFATLRDSSTFILSNSTFAWCAAFLGHQKRYIPQINCWPNQKLETIEESDTRLESSYISLLKYPQPAQILPLAGEQIQSLCDRTILNKEKESYHKYLDFFVPEENRLYLEEEWTPLQVERIFVYQDLVEESLSKVCKSISGVKLLVIHNGDTSVPFSAFSEFFEVFPDAHIYLQNNIYSHPKIHSLPMGVQNKMWRKRDTFLTYQKAYLNEKNDLAVCSWLGSTHPVRKELREYLEKNSFDGLRLLEKVSPQIYEGYLERACFSFCPPGNANDTHRLWETLYAKTIPIVLKDDFIERLQYDFPSLPFYTIDSFVQDSYKENLEHTLQKIDSIPLPFCCLLVYWKLLFDTYSERSHV